MVDIVAQYEKGKRDFSGVNLCKADLRGVNLCKANLYGANLYGANLYGANLYGANLYGANLSRANLHGVNLHGVNLHRANLMSTHTIAVQGLRWSVVKYPTDMQIGCERHSYEKWNAFTDEEIATMDDHALEFWRENKRFLLTPHHNG